MSELPQGYTHGAAVGTVLVRKPDSTSSFTVNQETDARTAVTRGLAEYLSQLSYDDWGGRRLTFERVFQTWADPEDEGVYPSAAVYAEGPGVYEASQFQGSVSVEQRVSLPEQPDSIYVVSPSTYGVDLSIDVRANDPEARKALCAMLERDLNPVDWRYGFVLILPHYFNQRATYEMIESSYEDAEAEVQQRLRRARFRVRASVPMTLLRRYPNAKVRATAVVE